MTFSVLGFLHKMIWVQIWLSFSCLNKWQNEVFHCNDLIWYHTWLPDVWGVHWPNVSMTRSLTKCQLTQSVIFGWRVHVMSIIFIHIWNFAGLYISSYCYFLHIFCLGVLGIACGWSDMAWHMSPTPREGMLLKCSKMFLQYISFSIPLQIF